MIIYLRENDAAFDNIIVHGHGKYVYLFEKTVLSACKVLTSFPVCSEWPTINIISVTDDFPYFISHFYPTPKFWSHLGYSRAFLFFSFMMGTLDALSWCLAMLGHQESPAVKSVEPTC